MIKVDVMFLIFILTAFGIVNVLVLREHQITIRGLIDAHHAQHICVSTDDGGCHYYAVRKEQTK